VFQAAVLAIQQTQKLASALLAKGMLNGKTEQEIKMVVQQLSTRNVYHSHGSVIDHLEAASLGLKVEYLRPEDDLWKAVWLLRCMYEYDARAARVIKIFEGNTISSRISAP
jgi:hypothetical protein